MSFTLTPFQVRLVSSSPFHNWWETYMAHFNNDDDLIEAIQGYFPSFLLHQLACIFLILLLLMLLLV